MPTPPSPPSIKVYGSATLRVPPDLASIVVAVSRVDPQPPAAFAAARAAAKSVNAFLHSRALRDVGTSNVSLEQEHRFANGEQRFVGYRASIRFSVLLRNTAQVEETLTGLVAAGANDLTSVTFQTSRLKNLRADARRRAVAAAREKADLYCAAASVTAGRVLAIEDLNPDLLNPQRVGGHVTREGTPIDDPGDLTAAIDPAAITIGAAVNITYELLP